jgi:nitroimidazol reductase NimA-like FMN-containing flavoprotein (pyridoxamine 5'-phosphate oxidase superfamily)
VTDDLRPQKRGRRIAMTDDERDAYLIAERTCRVATIGPDGPHATPLWFAWHEGCIWLYSITRSQRWADLAKDPRIGVVVDGGHDYDQLRGVEITGTVQPVAEVPRTGEPNEELREVEAQFGLKYFGGADMFHDGRHAWLKVTPSKITSWDFRKLADL